MEAESASITLESPLGTFVLRRATIMDQFKIGRRRATLLESKEAEPADWNLAHAVAGIDVLSTKKPEGFAWDTCYDMGAVWDLWTDYREWEDSFAAPKSTGETTEPGA